MPEIVQQAATLADAFRRHHLPVVLVTVTGAPPGRTETPRRDFTANEHGYHVVLPPTP